MFSLMEHQHSYHHGMRTVISNILPKELCDTLRARVKELINSGNIQLVSHSEKGTMSELDGGWGLFTSYL